MRWLARLEGGPFDGDQGTLRNFSELPERVWAFRCPDCKRVHWATEVEKRSEEYCYDRMEDKDAVGNVAVYVHADVDLSDLPVIRDCVPV